MFSDQTLIIVMKSNHCSLSIARPFNVKSVSACVQMQSRRGRWETPTVPGRLQCGISAVTRSTNRGRRPQSHTPAHPERIGLHSARKNTTKAKSMDYIENIEVKENFLLSLDTSTALKLWQSGISRFFHVSGKTSDRQVDFHHYCCLSLWLR